jgi:SAM-dependent methyltransferase
MDELKITSVVREAYSGVVQNRTGCCSGGSCGADTRQHAKSCGYSDEELAAIPDGANFGLSCGNPTALAGLKEGEVVLDLGSGAGFDCFLAASIVGISGKAIGVDMTPAMLEKARENARTANVGNVEFRLGEIEHLPVVDNSVDVVISNCVINLSARKQQVFSEIHRVLKPGGRVSISDVALVAELPPEIKASAEAYVGCVAGAVLIDDYRRLVEASGLTDIRLTVKGSSGCGGKDSADPFAEGIASVLKPGASLDDYAVSLAVEARKADGGRPA